MRDHDAAMTAYAQLAVLSHGKQQPLARDRFLLLCGLEACRAGWLDVAERCFQLHNAHHSTHQLTHFSSFPEALRDPEFVRVITRWERWCSYERAEHLLQALGKSARGDQPEIDRSAWVQQLLSPL